MRSDSESAPPTLEARGIVKRFGGYVAVRGVDLTIRPGEITALAGPNGAGKTTMFHILSGNLRPDSGCVLLNGKDVTGLAPWKMARRGVGLLFQDSRIFENLTAKENVEAALVSAGGNRQDSAYWLDYVHLGSKADMRASLLSCTERKLLAIVRLLALKTRLLLLDEPMAALPPDEIELMCGFMRSLASEHRISIALIEHKLDVVKRLADTVCFLHEGEMLQSGTADAVFSDRRVKELYEGMEESASKTGPVKFVSSLEAAFGADGRVPAGVAYLRRDGNVFGSLSVADNLKLAGWRTASGVRTKRLADILSLFPFLGERSGQRADTLSGGQRQALALAMTMCRDASAYFLDEPSAGLAPRTAAQMYEAIGRFAKGSPGRNVFIKEST